MTVRKWFSPVLSIILAGFLLVSGEAGADVLAKKSLDRFLDAVQMQGQLTPSVLGTPIANLRLYAHENGKFMPIRFQIDEMTGKDGDIVFYHGPVINKEQGNGKYDAWDLLCFQADDSGDKVNKDEWAPGTTKGAEIELIDPVTGEKGWVYLLAFASNPPAKSSLPDYVKYDYDTENFEGEYHFAHWTISEDGRHTVMYRAGGQGTTDRCAVKGADTMDRIKIRAEMKLMFGSVAIRSNEDTANTDVIAYNLGPVRVIRRMETYTKLPGGLKGLRMVNDNWYYRSFASCPSRSDIGVKLGNIATSAVIRIGFDWTPKCIGATVSNSHNTRGALVDGKMGDAERNWKPEHPDWFMLAYNPSNITEKELAEAAKSGLISAKPDANVKTSGLMYRFIFTPEFQKNIKTKCGVIDDSTTPDPPERYPGNLGYQYEDLDITETPAGRYYLFTDFYVFPNATPAEIPTRVVAKYMQYQDNPLKVKGENLQAENMTKYIPNLERKYRSCLPRKGSLSKEKMGKSRE